MALRKEQVLVLASLAVGAWIWRSGGAEWQPPRLQAQVQAFEAAAQPKAPLLDGVPREPARRRWFREPSETQPLPPRDLPLPELEPMDLVALPLDISPDLQRADLLALPGTVTPDVTLQPGAAAVTAETPADPAPAAMSRADKKKRYERQYDRIWVQGKSEEHFGILRAEGHDLYALEAAQNFDGVVLHLLEFSLAEEKLRPPEVTFGNDERQKITKIELANNLRNRVAKKVRSVRPGAPVFERQQMIDELVLWGRDEAWVYDVALEQAEILAKVDAGLASVRAKARVLFAKGDIAGEFALYQSLPNEGELASFRLEALGRLEMRLGLHERAEQDLRAAVKLTPGDARAQASLAVFLRRRGRANEAYAAATRAAAALGSVVDKIERDLVTAAIVSCQLGVGDLDGARTTLGMLRADAEVLQSFLRASIDYAAGNLAAARDGFRNAATAGHGRPAQLGLAACQVRLGEWQEALLGFEAVAVDAPLLRDKALCGLSLLYLRLGQYDAAMTQADRALEANPQNPYALYLRARAQAGQGQVAQALETLQQVLRLRDDFVPAVAAVAELHQRLMVEGDVAEQATHALAAMRYADRAVALSAAPSPVPRAPSVTLLLRQALAHYRAADLRGAKQAFEAARDAAAGDDDLFAQAGLAVVDYAAERVDDARPQLERMVSDLAREHPMRAWAAETLKRIDDHAQKEQLDDHFERQELGNVWAPNADGALGPSLDAGQMLFRGRFSKTGEVSATRSGALPKGGKFLAVGARIQVGAQHQGQDSFAGLRIQSRGGAGADFIAQVGVYEGKMRWQVREGREEMQQTPPGGDAVGAGLHALELRVEDRGENLFRLVFLFDGVAVHTKDVTMLRPVDQKELETVLVVSGRANGNVEVRFDDYHLQRRKD